MAVAQLAGGFRRAARRPIDKSIVAVNKDAVDATDVTTVLLTTTFPCTVVGLRWDIAFFQAAGTGEGIFHWAIVVVRDGVTIDTLAISDAAAFFEPEQNCLVFGVGVIDNNSQTKSFTGDTKTMRKMKGGDTLVFVAKGVATNTLGIRGVIQFFCKT